ncbi:MAG: preprotein translocase subunit SecG [Eubacteriaceae bacterium]|jgi:preprotein translocase subunit SecG|nr:preprotein translocase subunit SecG [Eubacteriaceae bacterium]
MTNFLVGLVIATGLILIASILLQPGKSAGLGEIGGGAEALFGKKKAKGFEAKLELLTKISAVVFMLSLLLYNYLV